MPCFLQKQIWYRNMSVTTLNSIINVKTNLCKGVSSWQLDSLRQPIGEKWVGNTTTNRHPSLYEGKKCKILYFEDYFHNVLAVWHVLSFFGCKTMHSLTWVMNIMFCCWGWGTTPPFWIPGGGWPKGWVGIGAGAPPEAMYTPPPTPNMPGAGWGWDGVWP